MANKEGKQWWDPYETSHKRQFIYRPNTATEILLCPVSTSFTGSYSHLGPFGSTVYNKDFCWKSPCKPEPVCTGRRRNNPHPSQSFMTWRLPRDATHSPEYARFPCNYEAEVCKAVAAQYRSVYRWDFTGPPQGAERSSAAQHGGRRVRISADTETRDNYRRPRRNPELLSDGANSRGPTATCRGIVPTVVQRHLRTRSDLTSYDRFCGKTTADVSPVAKSLLPQELQQPCRVLAEKDKEAVKRVSSKDSSPDDGEEGNKLPAVNPSSPEWICHWTGPQ